MSVNSDGAASVVVDKKGPPVGGSQDVPACPNLRLNTHLACLGRFCCGPCGRLHFAETGEAFYHVRVDVRRYDALIIQAGPGGPRHGWIDFPAVIRQNHLRRPAPARFRTGARMCLSCPAGI